MAEKITKRADDYSQWYLDIVKRAGLAENSDVRGCMVIKPHGYAIWENMQRALDRMFKDTGHVNAYFPLFIPKSFLAREEEMAEGFAKECAVVTHYRLKAIPGKGIEVDPECQARRRTDHSAHLRNDHLEHLQELDPELPRLCRCSSINGPTWCAGKCARGSSCARPNSFGRKATPPTPRRKKRRKKPHRILEVYRTFAEDWMAMPVLTGPKSDGQKFPGAIYTLCIEAMMQDRKALQAGTSHFLGQNFAKAFDVKFQNQAGQLEYAWATSWGVSTRLIGGAHHDALRRQGLVLPPRLAPIHVVIVPIFRKARRKSGGSRGGEQTGRGHRGACRWAIGSITSPSR